MYGHQFYRFPVGSRVQFLNTALKNGHYQSLEELADDIFLDAQDMKSELKLHGYIFVPEMNQFVKYVGTSK